MVDFISSGSTLLDEVLGGGYALGRMVHIVGDPSTGKTQLAIEASANFVRKYGTYLSDVEKKLLNLPDFSKVMYCDAEAAFDPDYALQLGLPVDDVEFVQPKNTEYGITVEDFAISLDRFIAQLPENAPGLYILDSLDALPSLKEASTPFDERDRGYGLEKTKLLGEIFRTSVTKMNQKNACLIVISQTRDNVSGYGPKKIFSGGSAPKFYASQRLRLTNKGSLDKTVKGVNTTYGVHVMAECDKNKIGKPYRSCEYDIVFDYGIDDLKSNLDFLFKYKQESLLPKDIINTAGGTPAKGADTPYKKILKMDKEERKKAIEDVSKVASEFYKSVQTEIAESLPSGKYD